MNYLGHIYLSMEDAEWMLGNLVTDMLQLKELNLLKGNLRRGMLLHQWIDEYTDRDKDVRLINAKLQPVQGKYASVVSDILFDFLICHNWYRLSDTSFDDFCQTTYNLIEDKKSKLPPRIEVRLSSMVRHQWLHQQAHWKGLNATLRRMDERTRFPSNFKAAGIQLLNDFQEINALFISFFKRIQSEVEIYKSNLQN